MTRDSEKKAGAGGETPEQPQQRADAGKKASACGGTFKQFQETKASKEKQRIARYVLTRIPIGSAVFLDAGSTVEHVAKAMINAERDGKRLNLTIMTNNMGVFNSFNACENDGGPPLGHSLFLLLTGGDYDKEHDALFGWQAAKALENFFPRVVVIGTSGFTVDGGVFYHGHSPEEATKTAILKKPTVHRIIVCDYRKIGQTDAFLGCGLKELKKHCERCTIVTSAVPEGAEYEPHRQRMKSECDRLQKEFDANIRELGGLCLVQIGEDCNVFDRAGDEAPPDIEDGC